jgi:hypothetical protein
MPCLFVLLLLLLAAPYGGAQGCAAQELNDFVGTYAYVPEHSESIDAAIDAGVARINFIVRQIARPRLRKTNTAYQQLAFRLEADTLSIQMDQRQPIRLPASGATVPWRREDNELFEVNARLSDGALVQQYVAEDGQRTNVFTLSENGRTLHLQVTVRSPKLKDDVVYRLAYRRTDPAAAD